MNTKNKRTKTLSSTDDSSKRSRSFFEGIYVYILVVLIGYMGADLTLLYLRPKMLPQEAPPTRQPPTRNKKHESLFQYKVITDRNIFNEEGLIPRALADDKKEETNDRDEGGPATLTRLPLELLGTIVHRNPRKSVATILPKGRSHTKATAFRVEEEISDMAKILSIQRRKVIFKNLNSGKKEYVEIPEDSKVSINYKDSPRSQAPSEVTQNGSNHFSIKRSEVLKYTSNPSEVLKQARMSPNIRPDGEVDGFRFVFIKPSSIYTKLGFKPGDIIKTVNGEPVNSPTKALELYNALKTADQIQVGVERSGTTTDHTYSITE